MIAWLVPPRLLPNWYQDDCLVGTKMIDGHGHLVGAKINSWLLPRLFSGWCQDDCLVRTNIIAWFVPR
jgi:hypothetical protein